MQARVAASSSGAGPTIEEASAARAAGTAAVTSSVSLCIMMLSGWSITLGAEPFDTIATVMEKFSRETGIPSSGQCLMLHRRCLDASCTLSHYNIRTEAILHCKLSLEGGGCGGAGRGGRQKPAGGGRGGQQGGAGGATSGRGSGPGSTRIVAPAPSQSTPTGLETTALTSPAAGTSTGGSSNPGPSQNSRTISPSSAPLTSAAAAGVTPRVLEREYSPTPSRPGAGPAEVNLTVSRSCAPNDRGGPEDVTVLLESDTESSLAYLRPLASLHAPVPVVPHIRSRRWGTA
jgi:hypothetical protein